MKSQLLFILTLFTIDLSLAQKHTDLVNWYETVNREYSYGYDPLGHTNKFKSVVIGQNLFSDKYFVPAFGTSVKQMGFKGWTKFLKKVRNNSNSDDRIMKLYEYLSNFSSVKGYNQVIEYSHFLNSFRIEVDKLEVALADNNFTKGEIYEISDEIGVLHDPNWRKPISNYHFLSPKELNNFRKNISKAIYNPNVNPNTSRTLASKYKLGNKEFLNTSDQMDSTTNDFDGNKTWSYEAGVVKLEAKYSDFNNFSRQRTIKATYFVDLNIQNPFELERIIRRDLEPSISYYFKKGFPNLRKIELYRKIFFGGKSSDSKSDWYGPSEAPHFRIDILPPARGSYFLNFNFESTEELRKLQKDYSQAKIDKYENQIDNVKSRMNSELLIDFNSVPIDDFQFKNFLRNIYYGQFEEAAKFKIDKAALYVNFHKVSSEIFEDKLSQNSNFRKKEYEFQEEKYIIYIPAKYSESFGYYWQSNISEGNTLIVFLFGMYRVVEWQKLADDAKRLPEIFPADSPVYYRFCENLYRFVNDF